MPPAPWTPPMPPSCANTSPPDARNVRGYLAEAQATARPPPPAPRSRRPTSGIEAIDSRPRQMLRPESSAPMRIGGWDRIVLPSAIAAVLAVAVTLLVVKQFWPVNVRSPEDREDHRRTAGPIASRRGSACRGPAIPQGNEVRPVDRLRTTRRRRTRLPRYQR